MASLLPPAALQALSDALSSIPSLSPLHVCPTCHPLPFPALPGDGYVQADARGPPDYEEHLYVNTQRLDAVEPGDICEASLPMEDSPKKDLFDMRACPSPSHLGLHGEALGNPKGGRSQAVNLSQPGQSFCACGA